MDEMLTAEQAAEKLGYHVHHVYRLLRLGAIQGRQFNRVWMIDQSEVERVKREQDNGGRYHHGKTTGPRR